MSDIRNNPHFVLFPLNNARTGYKPFPMPVLYVEPRRYDSNGNGIADSQALRLVYKVIDAPDVAKVNGPFNGNIRIPDRSLFEIEVSNEQLASKQIDLTGLVFYDNNGNETNFYNAKEGYKFKYTLKGTSNTSGSNPTDLVVYYPDAVYYDVSDVEINVDELPRPKRYLFVWESIYFRRIPTANGGLKCISDSIGVSQRILDVNHPGDVHEFMFRTTPGLYFDYDGMKLSTDSTLEFYRPLADILQDIFDEQELLDGINHINKIPAEFIPYLSYLIGWDLPNFPGTTDSLRRTVLRRGSELQKLKSSRRVINELFETFGFTVDIINLWNSVDGNSLVGPDNGIDITEVTQTDLVLNDYNSSGFGIGSIPFIHKPQRDSQIVLYAWLVKNGSPKHNSLLDISNGLSNNLEAENIDGLSINENGNLQPSFVNSIGKNIGNGIIGFSEVLVGSGSYSNGRPILNHRNIKFLKNSNTIQLFFDHEMSVEKDCKIFVFASYRRNKINVPKSLSNTRSNKFDIKILDNQGLPVDFTLLLSLLEFLFRLKSFHSLLRKIQASLLLSEVYNVSDFCVDGQDVFKPGTNIGDLQTPPAIIPNDVSGCFDDNNRGFKNSDLLLRNSILNGLEEEFQAWKSLSDDCQYTKNGQDKVTDDGVADSVTSSDLPDYDHQNDNRQTLCSNDNNLDYCYKGRVQDLINNILVVPLRELRVDNPCGLYMGSVVYWEKDSKLHYSDNPYFDSIKTSDENTLVYNPVNIDISKDNLNFPSHRMMFMNKLLDDFNYTVSSVLLGMEYDIVRKRPWDDDVQCGINDELNATIVEDTSGNQVLIWDESDLIYYGNNLNPDIPSLDDHIYNVTDDNRIITHSVYQFSSPSHPSLTFDQSVFVSDATDEIISDPVTGFIFNSCSDSDFIGGYPASYNMINVNTVLFNDQNITDEEDFVFCDATCEIGKIDKSAISVAFGMPQSTSSRTSARFLFGSMEYVRNNESDYKYYIPYRLDCNCNVCDSTYDEIDCNADNFYNGSFDINPDKLSLNLAISLFENVGSYNRLSNGELKNLMCLKNFSDCTIPDNNHFEYQDDYGIIYEVEWNISENTLDISIIKKDPKIPGEESSGYLEKSIDGIRIFRKGIISTVRMIIKFDANGNGYIDAEGYEDKIDYFQSNKVCNEKFDDPFEFKIDCYSNDYVDFIVTDGPSWSGTGGSTDNNISYWADVDDTAGSDLLIWSSP